MSPPYAECVVSTPGNPFIHDSEAYSQSGKPWSIKTDSDSITLMCIKPAVRPDDDEFFACHDDVTDIVKSCPVTAKIFKAEVDASGALILEVPTLERANAFAAETFAGLAIAGIRLFQTKDKKNTEPPRYLELLCDEDKLAVAYTHTGYLHDVVGHWLAAAVIEKRELGIFKAVLSDVLRPQVANTLAPGWYTEALAEVFDTYTEDSLRRLMDEDDPDANDGYLLSHCLDHLDANYPEVFETVAEAMQRQGAGAAVRNAGGRLVLPWELAQLSAHYRQVAARMRQPAH